VLELLVLVLVVLLVVLDVEVVPGDAERRTHQGFRWSTRTRPRPESLMCFSEKIGENHQFTHG
jgi:hypothetical protein